MTTQGGASKAGGTAFVVVIPARYASTRFPGKALADVAGKPMVIRVAERAAMSGAQASYIATDDQRIEAAARTHGIASILTSEGHATGTDRVAEAVRKLALPDEAIVVNVQGDEPLIDPDLIARVARCLYEHADAVMSTACHAIHERADIFNPNVVKVALDAKGFALYFSRAPIPYARDAWSGGETDAPSGLPCYRHIGIYAYRAGFLKKYAELATSPLEACEALEQLRVLWHGLRIAVAISETAAAPGVDTPGDLEKVRTLAVGWPQR